MILHCCTNSHLSCSCHRRKALHQYDPPDLMDAATTCQVENTEMAVEDAVPATPTPYKRRYVCFNDDSSMEGSPVSVKSDYGGKDDLDDFAEGGAASDSDDDIL